VSDEVGKYCVRAGYIDQCSKVSNAERILSMQVLIDGNNSRTTTIYMNTFRRDEETFRSHRAFHNLHI
jgi:hypothetical protein